MSIDWKAITEGWTDNPAQVAAKIFNATPISQITGWRADARDMEETFDNISNSAIDFASMFTNLDKVLIRQLENDGKILTEDQIEQIKQKIKELENDFHDYEIEEARLSESSANPAGSAYFANLQGDLRRQRAAETRNRKAKEDAEKHNKEVSDRIDEYSRQYDEAIAARDRAQTNLAGTLRKEYIG